VEDEVYSFGPFRVFVSRRELWKDGRAVAVGPRALEVLVVLLRRAGGLVTKADLLADVWSGVPVADNAISAQIAALRRVLGEPAGGGRYIQTVTGRGYRFVGVLEGPDEAAPEAVRPPARGIRAPLAVAAGAMIALLAGWVAYRTVAGRHWELEGMRTLAMPVSTAFDPALSPKGGWIAFTGEDSPGGPSHIYLRGLGAGGDVLPLTQGARSDSAPAWSPSGDRIAFVRHSPGAPCGIVVKEVPAGRESAVGRCVLDESTPLAWSPSGSAIYFVDRLTPTAPLRVMRLDLVDGRAAAVTSPDPRLVGDDLPTPSPDGRRLAFLRLDAGRWQAWVQTLSTGALAPVGPAARSFNGLGWSRDGRTVFLSVQLGGSAALLAASPGERRARAITLSAVEFGRMSVGPGDTLALETTQKRWRIVSGAAAADPVEGRAEDIDISANGVAAVIAHRAGDSGIYVEGRNGETRRLPNLAATSIFGARWSPDGNRLLFLADTARGSGIFEIGLDGAPPTLKVPISLNLVDPPAWSADGRSVTYPLFDGSRWRLWRASLDGPPNTRPVSDFGWCGVRRMGDALYAVRTDVAGIWKLDPTPMLIAPGYPKNQCYIWTVGGGRFAYPDPSGVGPRTVVTGSIAGGALSATPTHGVPLDIEGSSIALDPKTGKLVVLELADQRDIAIVSLRRR
jgi:DNA-binding winged helix-turn-helix (wHTH) protein/Tol biopolymer transport system component